MSDRAPAISSSATDPPPVVGFMHIALHGCWQKVIEEQLRLIHSSGLYQRSRRIAVGVVGPGYDSFQIPDEKYEIVHRSANFEEFEFPTLRRLHHFCLSNRAMVYYLHTKGVFHDTLCAHDWRRFMQYFIVERHEDCFAALKAHDICGVNWSAQPWPHFSGNFWWATSEYVRRLIRIDQLSPLTGPGQAHRQQCERWIGSGTGVRVACLHQSGLDHYESPYPRSRYADHDGRPLMQTASVGSAAVNKARGARELEAAISVMTLDQQMQSATQFHHVGRLREAEAVYRHVLATHPNHADAMHLWGLVALKMNQVDKALDLMRRAIDQNPRVAAYHCNLGDALASAGRLDDAIASYRQVIQLQPDHPGALNSLSSALKAKGTLTK